MPKRTKAPHVFEEFVTDRDAAVLRALQNMGNKATVKQIATYLYWDESEVEDISWKLHRCRMARRDENSDGAECLLQMSQPGELALLSKAGYDFRRYLQLEESHFESCRFRASVGL